MREKQKKIQNEGGKLKMNKDGAKYQKGITLIALVVTIVVILILAAISINVLSGEDGIISQAIKSKEEQEIGKEKELISLAYTGLKSEDINRQITAEDMENEINNINGAGTVEVTGQGSLKIEFLESNRNYLIDVATGKVQENNNQENNNELEELVGEAYAIVLDNSANSQTDIYPMYFVRSSEIIEPGDYYEGLEVLAVHTGFETDVYNYVSNNTTNAPWDYCKNVITSVIIKDEIKPISTACWFQWFDNCYYFDLSKLNTDSVTNMMYMLSNAGYNTTTFEIIGLDKWNTSSVTNMCCLFRMAGYSATTWNIGDLSNWDVSSVTDMYYMFDNAGSNASTFNIEGLSNWNTVNVTDMSSMFNGAGGNASTWNIGDISNWNVSSVTNMNSMFAYAAYRASTWNIGDLSKWNVSNVKYVDSMFKNAGYNATYILDLTAWSDKISQIGKNYHNNFNNGVETKVIAPTWVN